MVMVARKILLVPHKGENLSTINLVTVDNKGSSDNIDLHVFLRNSFHLATECLKLPHEESGQYLTDTPTAALMFVEVS